MLHLKLFGETTLIDESGRPVAIDLGGVKPRQILEMLALSSGPLSKDRIADLLWDQAPPKSYLGTLESYVCVLRRGLAHGRGRTSAIRTVMHGYILDADVVTTDVSEFRSLARAAAQAPTPEAALPLFREALALVGGELLASESYAGWAVREREQFSLELSGCATAAARAALATGAADEAVRMAQVAFAQDALGEEANRVLMRALAASGRRSEALKTYLRLRGALEAELGIAPSAATQTLYVELLGTDDGAARDLTSDRHDDLSTLLDLVRHAVGAMPGRAQATLNKALEEVVADLALAG